MKELERALRAAPLGLATFGADGRFRCVSEAYAAFFGRRPEELAGTPIDDLSSEGAEREASAERVRQLVSGERAELAFERCWTRPDGRAAWGRITIRRLPDEPDQPELFVACLVDVTAERRVRDELDESLQRFEMLAANLKDVIWMASPDASETHYVSPAFEEMWGVSTAEYLARPTAWLERVHPDDRERVIEAFTQSPAEGASLVYRIVRPDGTVRWIWDRNFNILDADGRVVRRCGIATDVTRQHEAEELIARQQARLVTSSKMAALGEMAAGLAHEINNPLAIIDGRLSLLARRLRGGEVPRELALAMVDSAAATTSRIASIVRAMRTFSRDATGDPMVVTSVSELLEQTLTFCGERFRNHGIELTLDVAPGLALLCRPVQVTQILVNLLNNAYDALTAKSVPLTRRWLRLGAAAAGDVVRLSVEDGGAGIPPELRERLFQPFFTTKPPGAGTGLGLGVARGLAEAHGGTLVLDASSPATRFVLTLPRGVVSSDRPGASAPCRSAP